MNINWSPRKSGMYPSLMSQLCGQFTTFSFLRQVTTCKGIVMGRLRSAQRQLEVELMRFCHNKLGAVQLIMIPSAKL